MSEILDFFIGIKDSVVGLFVDEDPIIPGIVQEIIHEGRDYQITIGRNRDDRRVIKIDARESTKTTWNPIVEYATDEFVLSKDERAKVRPTYMFLDLPNSEMVVYSEDGSKETRRFTLTAPDGGKLMDGTTKFILKEK